jgi:hypothetical protein
MPDYWMLFVMDRGPGVRLRLPVIRWIAIHREEVLQNKRAPHSSHTPTLTHLSSFPSVEKSPSDLVP